MQQASSTTTANNSAFTALQNNSNSDSNGNSNSYSNSNSNLRWYKECICGLIHQYSDCYYIAKQKRP